MNITLNGQDETLSDCNTIAALLQAKGYEGKLVAVAQNGHFVPKSTYATATINAGDKIEIVAPMQGG